MNKGQETDLIHNADTLPMPPLEQTALTGMLLKERYQIEGELGRGGIGVTYLARDQKLRNRLVVVKVLHERLKGSKYYAYFKGKFEDEITALTLIKHPNVVDVLEAGDMPNGEPFFVMQHVEGTSLQSIIDNTDKGQLGFARVANIVRQLGQALSAVHDKRVVHRDVKPANVMVQTTSDGEEIVKLIDFGLATVEDPQGAKPPSTKVAGSLPYMAPEQLKGQPNVSSDIWSLGVIAYQMLTGSLPFPAETVLQLYEAQMEGPKSPREKRPDLPPAAEPAVMKALEFAAENRHARAKDFGEALAQALTSLPPDPEPEPPRPDWRVVAAIVLVTAMTLASVYYFASSRKSESTTSSITPSPSATPVGSGLDDMVLIPGGEFTMGRSDGQPDEREEHKVVVEDFYLDKYEVTNAQYKKFVDAESYPAPEHWAKGMTPELPVTHVTWKDATAYAKWAGKRLPSEAEWEYAASNGGQGMRYVWGNEWIGMNANVGVGWQEPAPIKSKTFENDVNVWRVFGLTGNVSEWVNDQYLNYQTKTPFDSKCPDCRVIRGGNYSVTSAKSTATYRFAHKPELPPPGLKRGEYKTEVFRFVGFRCAKSKGRP